MASPVSAASSPELLISPGRLDRWRHIRDVSIALFEKRGFAEVSVDDIADAAGVSRRTFFNYFATKAGVVFDPDPEESTRLSAFLERSVVAEGAWSGLANALVAYLASQESVVTSRRGIVGADPSLDGVHALSNSDFEVSILSWLENQGVRGLHARIHADVALGVVRSAFIAWQPEAGYRMFLDMLLTGFDLVGAGMRSAGG